MNECLVNRVPSIRPLLLRMGAHHTLLLIAGWRGFHLPLRGGRPKTFAVKLLRDRRQPSAGFHRLCEDWFGLPFSPQSFSNLRELPWGVYQSLLEL